MFYLKEKLTEAAELKIEIGDNVYNICPRCGRETKVDLTDWIGDEDFDLFASAIYCDECSAEVAKRRERDGK